MTPKDFLDLLDGAAFPAPVAVTQPANGRLGEHGHDFEVYALVTSGSITITTDGVESFYGVGDMFHLARQQPHSERYGPQGVEYMASRK
jgi:hypothetical protein